MRFSTTGLQQALKQTTIGKVMSEIEDIRMRKLFKAMLLSMYLILTGIIWTLAMLLYWPSLLVVLATWNLAIRSAEASEATYSSMRTIWRKDDST